MAKEPDEADGPRRYFKRPIINLYILYIKTLYDLEENLHLHLSPTDAVTVITIQQLKGHFEREKNQRKEIFYSTNYDSQTRLEHLTLFTAIGEQNLNPSGHQAGLLAMLYPFLPNKKVYIFNIQMNKMIR